MTVTHKILFTILSTIASWCALAQNDDFIIFSGNATKELAQQIADKLNVPLGDAIVSRFNDGEINIKINNNVRGKHVYVIQSTSRSRDASVNDNLMELYFLARTLRRASVDKITAIIPYYGYARQDRKTTSRVPISASDVAMLLERSGIDRVVSLDLHCGQIQGFFHDIPVDNIYGSILFAPKIATMPLKNPVIVSPDAGGVERAKKFQELLSTIGVKTDLAIIVKQRKKAGEVGQINLIGEVRDRDAIIIDDICDTGGTLVKASTELKKLGANNIYATITHPVFSNNAIDKIESSDFTKVFVSDTISLPQKSNKIEQVSIATLFSQVIEKLNSSSSLSELFIPKNTYIKEFGMSKIISAKSVYPKFTASPMIIANSKSNLLPQVIVASTNNIKISAARHIISSIFNIDSNDISVDSTQCSSGVSEQPLGLNEAQSAVNNRIKEIKKLKNTQNRYIVAIENFFSTNQANPSDHALIQIEDPQGNIYKYLSKGVTISPKIYQEAVKTKDLTIGRLLAIKYNVKSQDWHSYVTNGEIDRYEQIISSIDI